MRITLRVPPRFSLKAVLYSHGWSVLAPFQLDDDEHGVSVALKYSGFPAMIARVRQSGRSVIVTTSVSPAAGREALRDHLRRTFISMLRLDENFSQLYKEMDRHARFRWVPRLGAGRILRAATAFEDTVKIICTTNCSWELTTLMVDRLTQTLGTRVAGRRTFPTPAAMASESERFYRTTIRAGYRSPYLLELARRIVDGNLDLETLRTDKAPKEVMTEVLRSIKGVGPYAIDNLLRFHGIYDEFAHDSWIRAQYSRIYHNGRRVSDKTIERRYQPFGEWRGLAYWLDMTRPWYEDNFDFA